MLHPQGLVVAGLTDQLNDRGHVLCGDGHPQPVVKTHWINVVDTFPDALGPVDIKGFPLTRECDSRS
jgi:hypothetical protein